MMMEDGFVECTIDQNGWDGVLDANDNPPVGDDCDDSDFSVYPNALKFVMVSSIIVVKNSPVTKLMMMEMVLLNVPLTKTDGMVSIMT